MPLEGGLKKPCKISPSPVGSKGYPICWDFVQKRGRTHTRVVLEEKLGRPIKPGFCALHHCDNRRCIEQEHLYEGTFRDNARDREARNRSRKGIHHGNAMFTEADIKFIRQSLVSDRQLAKRFGVGATTVRRVKKRETWAHIK